MTATRQNGGIASISSYLKTTLIPSIQSVRIQNIYDYEPTDLQGFPAVTITGSEISGEFLDNARNKRVYRFVIRIFIDRNIQGVVGFGPDRAEQILRNVADEVVLALDGDYQLGGQCIDTDVFPIKFGYVERENNNIRLAEITLDCWDVVIFR